MKNRSVAENNTLASRVTEVRQVAKVRERQWLFGVVAVSVAVKEAH